MLSLVKTFWIIEKKFFSGKMLPNLVTKKPNMLAFYVDNTFFYDPKIFTWENICHAIMWNKWSPVTYSLAVKFVLSFPNKH